MHKNIFYHAYWYVCVCWHVGNCGPECVDIHASGSYALFTVLESVHWKISALLDKYIFELTHLHGQTSNVDRAHGLKHKQKKVLIFSELHTHVLPHPPLCIHKQIPYTSKPRRLGKRATGYEVLTVHRKKTKLPLLLCMLTEAHGPTT